VAEQNDQENPVLLVREGESAGQRYVMHEESVVIGRSAESDFILPERQISREHVRIWREDDAYYIEDLNSKNGTWLNGVPLGGKARLKDGDEIQVALAVKISFLGSEATLPLSLENLQQEPPGLLRLDSEARQVYIRNQLLDPPLSLPQYRLMELLVENTGTIVTREQVVDAVWPESMGEGVSEQAIDALVRRLRDRLAELDEEHQYVVTVRGHGFRLDNFPEDAGLPRHV
jgi:hypothetical protein